MEELEERKNASRSTEPPTPHQRTIGTLLLIYVVSTVYIVLRSIVFSATDFAIAQAPVIAYFTIQTNILICLWLGAMVVTIMSGKKKLRFAMNINLAAALTTYSAVNALIFWFVLVPIFAFSENMLMFTPQNIWLHTVTPIIAAVMLDYMIIENTISEYKPKIVLSMVYPVIYITFAVVLAIRGTYLYPMFNPTLIGGWIGVAACMIGTIFFLVIIHLTIVQSINNKLE